jgi:hypothetical protein
MKQKITELQGETPTRFGDVCVISKNTGVPFVSVHQIPLHISSEGHIFSVVASVVPTTMHITRIASITTYVNFNLKQNAQTKFTLTLLSIDELEYLGRHVCDKPPVNNIINFEFDGDKVNAAAITEWFHRPACWWCRPVPHR